MMDNYPQGIQRLIDESYARGYYDRRVEETESQDHAPVWAAAQLSQTTAALKVMPQTLEKEKLFCAISGLEQIYHEYMLSVQAANRRAHSFLGYLGRLWDALRNNVITTIISEPEGIWLQRVAYEFAKNFRDAHLVADLQITRNEDFGEQRQYIFKALTWKAQKK